ncbi:SAGA HAT/Core module component [Agyrium rufum]|nr:SAGA HAT/Core module component [Agyrium rufum]
MAARSRPRNGLSKEDRDDAHEERSMWESILRDLKDAQAINAESKIFSQRIVEKEEKMGKNPSVKDIEELQELYRANVKLSEQEQIYLYGEPADLIRNLGILVALRTATENEPQRSLPTSKVRKPKSNPSKMEVDGPADSPYPSPGILSSASRLKGNNVRSTSVAREKQESRSMNPKLEEGVESAKGSSAERAGKFVVGAEVAYRMKEVKEDGQWIQCTIINVTEIGNKKRYEVQDPEPDEMGAPGQIYKTHAGGLIPIPTQNTDLPDLPNGKEVLAKYPETTTFYRAEVLKMSKGVCKLRFDDDANQEMEVERRFVLEVLGK